MKWLVLLLFLATTASASFSGYTYERVITISSSNVQSNGGNLSNFPVLLSTNEVTLSTTSGSGGHLATTTGLDVVFSTKSDCSFLMNWDTETVQGVGVSTMNVWVNVPVLTTATLTAATFYMCYGNSGITTYQGLSSATWDSNFVGVYHFPNGTTLTARDSTSGANNGIIGNVSATTGKVDGAVNAFSTNSSTISVTWPMTPDWTTQIQNGTVSFCSWVNPITNPSEVGVVGIGHSNSGGLNLAVIGGNPSFWYSGGTLVRSGTVLTTAAWTYLCGTASSLSSIIIYINGTSDTTGSSSLGSFTLNPSNNALAIGNEGQLDSARYFNGTIDEIHLSKSTRSADWIKTSYNNQNSPSTFVTIGAETTDVAVPTPLNRGLTLIGGKMKVGGSTVSVK